MTIYESAAVSVSSSKARHSKRRIAGRTDYGPLHIAALAAVTIMTFAPLLAYAIGLDIR